VACTNKWGISRAPVCDCGHECPLADSAVARVRYAGVMTDSIDDTIIETPDGPMTFAEWKKKNPVQLPSRRTRGKNLPNKLKRFTDKG
jgi:hypothetical protein